MWQSDIKNRGFAILPSVFERNDMAALVKNLNEHKGLRSRAGLRRALALPSVAALAWDPRLLGLARKILGTKAFPYQATLFEKSPSANWLVAWHQDRALPLREKRDTPGWGPWSLKQGMIYCLAPTPALCQVLALRVHLDDSTKQNGPLRVLPGTHRRGVLSARDMRRLAEKIDSVECLVSRGGVLALRPLLIHSSSKSRSEQNRRVLHIEYAACDLFANRLRLVKAKKPTKTRSNADCYT
jgi:ectoine hydroxylase-related dioxygenase (phytanoyl-CoA dioxygenase family)